MVYIYNCFFFHSLAVNQEPGMKRMFDTLMLIFNLYCTYFKTNMKTILEFQEFHEFMNVLQDTSIPSDSSDLC